MRRGYFFFRRIYNVFFLYPLYFMYLLLRSESTLLNIDIILDLVYNLSHELNELIYINFFLYKNNVILNNN